MPENEEEIVRTTPTGPDDRQRIRELPSVELDNRGPSGGNAAEESSLNGAVVLVFDNDRFSRFRPLRPPSVDRFERCVRREGGTAAILEEPELSFHHQRFPLLIQLVR